MKTSHAKQVAAFEQLIGFCNAHGASYNPSKSSITITALEALLKQAQGSLEAVMSAKVELINTVNLRQQVFNGIPKLSTRIVNALAASDPAPGLFEDAMMIKRKFVPKRYQRPAVQSEAASQLNGSARRATSELDFESKAANFDRLLSLLNKEPQYKPNETELQTTSLEKFLTTLNERNSQIINSEIALSNLRINRNKLLYNKEGIHGKAMSVKRYVRSVYGPRSDEFRQIGKLYFKKGE